MKKLLLVVFLSVNIFADCEFEMILPNDLALKAQVIDIANHFNDSYVEFEVSNDNIHPKSYKALDEDIKKAI